MESMKFSEQKLQDIGLGICLPARQLRKGLQAKAGAEKELPLQLCWRACTGVSLRLQVSSSTTERGECNTD